MIKKKLVDNKFIFLFFIAYFFTGCFIYSDYGVGWDETAQHNIGAIVYEYASTKDSTKLFVKQEYQYHGAAWELFNYFLELKLNKREFREYVLLKHFNNWLLFFVGSVFLFLTAIKTTKNKWFALTASAMFILSPRIFAESFYNSKDVVSLSLYTIAIYSMLLFLEKKNILTAFFHAIVCALLIDVRITGITIPVFTVFFFFINYSISSKKEFRTILNLALFFILTIVFVIAFWPVLWKNPVQHFIAALRMMGKYNWEGSVLYMGKYYSAEKLPWHYALVWISTTTPVLYLIGFLTGIFFTIKNSVKKPFHFYKKHPAIVISLLCFFTPIISVIVFKSVLYDGWRHLYFVYSPFVLVATWGFYMLSKKIEKEKLTLFILAANFLFIAFLLFFNHPKQHTYFNILVKKGNPNQQFFETDYWGLSYKQAIEKVAKKDTSKIISVKFENFPGYSNLAFLQKSISSRFAIVDTCEDFYITNYRWQNGDKFLNYNKKDSILSYGKEICGIYALKQKPPASTYLNIAPLFLNFSKKEKNVSFTQYSLNKEDVAFIDSHNMYPLGASFECAIEKNKKVFVTIRFAIKCLSNSTKLQLTLGVRNTYNQINNLMYVDLEQKLKNNNNWQQFEITKQALAIPPGSKNIDVYFTNNSKQSFFIDNFEIEWMEK